MSKCQLPDGITIKPDGVNELDPCAYTLMEEHRNATVRVYQCPKCGSVDISWVKQDDTESTIFEELEE